MVVDGRNVTNYGMETSTSLRGAKNKFTRWCKDCGFVVLTVTNISPVRN
jgi:hypothetical protein